MLVLLLLLLVVLLRRGVVGGREGCAAVAGVHGVLARVGVAGEALAEDVGDGRQAVVGLVGSDVVDVRRRGEVGGLVGDVPGQGVGGVAAGEGLAERCGLDDAFVGELLVRGSHDAKPGRCAALPREAGRLCCKGTVLELVAAVTLGRLLLSPLLNDLLLMLPNVHAALDVLLHDGVPRHKARRQAREADLLDAESAVPCSQGSPRSAGSATDRVLGQVQFPRAVASGGDVWGAGFLLHDDLWWSSCTSRSARRGRKYLLVRAQTWWYDCGLGGAPSAGFTKGGMGRGSL